MHPRTGKGVPFRTPFRILGTGKTGKCMAAIAYHVAAHISDTVRVRSCLHAIAASALGEPNTVTGRVLGCVRTSVQTTHHDIRATAEVDIIGRTAKTLVGGP